MNSTFQFDILGTPYSLRAGSEFMSGNAVEIAEFTPDFVLQVEGTLSGSPISHHGQQAQALAYLRSNAGFDSVVGATVNYGSEPPARLVLQVATGYWFEEEV